MQKLSVSHDFVEYQYEFLNGLVKLFVGRNINSSNLDSEDDKILSDPQLKHTQIELILQKQGDQSHSMGQLMIVYLLSLNQNQFHQKYRFLSKQH